MSPFQFLEGFKYTSKRKVRKGVTAYKSGMSIYIGYDEYDMFTEYIDYTMVEAISIWRRENPL